MHFASLIANDTGVIKFFSWWPRVDRRINKTYNQGVKVCPARKLISSNKDDNKGKM